MCAISIYFFSFLPVCVLKLLLALVTRYCIYCFHDSVIKRFEFLFVCLCVDVYGNLFLYHLFSNILHYFEHHTRKSVFKYIWLCWVNLNFIQLLFFSFFGPFFHAIWYIFLTCCNRKRKRKRKDWRVCLHIRLSIKCFSFLDPPLFTYS